MTCLKNMKINYNFLIKGLDEKTFDLTLKHLALQYVQGANFSYNNEFQDDKESIVLNFVINKNNVSLISNFFEEVEKLYVEDDKKETKRAVSVLLVKFFAKLFNYKLPWGILTGIRPTKLFHILYKEYKDVSKVKSILKEKYLLEEKSIDILEIIFNIQLKTLPDINSINDNEVSIYIGIPFCPTKCAYCTFPAYQIKRKDDRMKPFLDMLFEEIDRVFEVLHRKNKDITTIYFGGGTPTSLSAEDLEKVIVKIYSKLNLKKLREITVEAGRPDTIDVAKLEVLKKYNINRISVNPQSFTNATLKAIGRMHSVEETIDKYKLSRAYIDTINMDMIVGLPGEDKEDIINTLNNFEELNPENITVHALSLKRASTMTKNRSKYPIKTGCEAEEMLNITKEWMQNNDYIPYYLYRQKNILANMENIGYSQKGHVNLYNIIIMEEVQTIIGIGCGASSKIIDKTGKIHGVLNPKDPVSYSNYSTQIEKKLEIMDQYL